MARSASGCSLQELLARGWQTPVKDANGYALLLAMKREGFTRESQRRIFALAVGGGDVAATLQSLLPPSDPTAEQLPLNDWWQLALQTILDEEHGRYESMSESRQWLAELSDMATVGDGSLNLRSLWQERANKDIRASIQARYELLRIRVVRVNPAYFNTARSLSALFETFLKSDRSFEYLRNLSAFLSDFEDTKRMEALVLEELNRPIFP